MEPRIYLGIDNKFMADQLRSRPATQQKPEFGKKGPRPNPMQSSRLMV
jgi:hypothetical protein